MWSWRKVSNHQVLARLHAPVYVIFQIRAKMNMDKCHIFDCWMKTEAFIVVLLWENQKIKSWIYQGFLHTKTWVNSCCTFIEGTNPAEKRIDHPLHPIIKEYFYTDSQMVLGYINNDTERFIIFVAKRVQLIREHSEPSQLTYIPYIELKENPVDYVADYVRWFDYWVKDQEFLW